MVVFLIILLVISSLGLIATVLLQSGRSAGLGAIAGAGETLFGKKKGMDDLFSKLSIAFAVLFLATSLGLSVIF